LSEYRGAILRNAILAAVGISLLVSVAIFGSTIVTQFHPSSPTQQASSVESKIPSTSSTQGSNSNSGSNTSSSSSTESSVPTSPSTTTPPPSTIAQISFEAKAFAFNNITKTIYALSNDSSASSVLEINATTNKVLGQIALPAGTQASSMIFNPDNSELYFVQNGANQSSPSNVIALNTQTRGVGWNETKLGMVQLALDPAHNILYGSALVRSANTEFVNVSVINGSNNSVEKNITLFQSSVNIGGGCCYLGPLLYNPVNHFLYESIGIYGPNGGFSSSLAMLDTSTNATSTLPLPISGNLDFAYNPQNGCTYVANNGFASSPGVSNPPYVSRGGNITVLNGSSYISTINLGDPKQNETAGSIVYDSQNQKLFVANGTLDLQNYHFVDQNLTVINPSNGAVTQVVPVETGGVNTLFLDSANGDLYLASPSTIYILSVTH
jgi:hypothetical protein